MVVEGNHPHIGDAKKKKNVIIMANGETDDHDSGRKTLKKRDRLKKKTTCSPITISSQEASPQRKKPLTREKSCGAIEVNNIQLMKKIPPP